MTDGLQNDPWKAVQGLENATKELQRLGTLVQASRLMPATKERALRVGKECKAVICQLLEHFSSAQLDSEPGDDAEALEKAMEEVLDDALERVDTSLDRARALLKAAEAPADTLAPAAEAGPVLAAQPVADLGYGAQQGSAPEPAADAGVRAGAKATKSAAFLAAHMDFSSGPRPQDTFNPPVDNSNEPFRPLLRPWQQALPDCPAPEPSDPPSMHPLQKKLPDLTYQPWQLEVTEPIMPQGLDETPLSYIDTLPALKELAGELASASEIAVDLEAHSYRSFQGFCCLMQLSTRRADYLVDVLALRSSIGPCLGPVFANAEARLFFADCCVHTCCSVLVVKVLHGADSDIVWLQRDFGIYVVNLFDTGQAARVLAYPSAGLAYLLSRMCGVKADKRWQLADWRVRPLSEEALLYARMDTHYLLYMYDRIKAELAEVPRVPDHHRPDVPARGPATMTGVVLERSRRLCLSQYQKELFTPTSYLDAFSRMQDRLTRQQLAVFAGLFAWRDHIARERDESIGFVMPKTLFMKLVKGIPQTTQELHSALGIRGKRSSPVVVELAAEVVQVITASSQNPESVPEPDQLRPLPKRPHEAGHAAASSLQSNGDQRTAAHSTVLAQEQCTGSSADFGQQPALLSDSIQGQAVPQANRSEQGKRQEIVMLNVASAGQGRPRLSSLQPKALPSLIFGPKKSSSLFRQAPKASSALPAIPVPPHPVLVPQQQGPARTAAVSAEAPSADKPMSPAEAGIATTEAAGATAVELEYTIASDPAVAMTVDVSEDCTVKPQAALAGPRTQSLPVQSQPTKLGSMFGASKRAKLGPGAAMLGMLSHSKQPARNSDQAATVSQLKAELALPFAGSFSPASLLPGAPPHTGSESLGALQAAAAATSGAAAPAPEGGVGDGLQKTSGAAVRSVMEDLMSENRFEALSSAPARSLQPKTDDKDRPEEYLPLPISEEYQLPSKGRRRSAQGQKTQPAQPRSVSRPDTAHLTAAHRASATMGRKLLDSMGRAASEQSLQAAEGWHPNEVEHRLDQGKHGGTEEPSLSLQNAADEEAAEQRPLGPVFPRHHKPAKPKRHGDGEGYHYQSSETQLPVSAYDFAAARATAKGLDVSSIMGLPAKRKAAHSGTSGRGGRSSGRGERDAAGSDKLSLGGAVEGDSKKQRKQKAFDPYSSFEANEIKGGKNRTAMHKMGNRSMTFS